MVTYEEFINNILESRGRFACGNEYHERHHIVPKSIGGTNDEENLIDLYAREHYEAHRLLALENPDNTKLVHAWWMMSHMSEAHQRDYELTAEEYEEARKAFSESMSGENHPMYGVHRFGELAPMYGRRGKNNPNYGSHRTEEQKKRLSEAKFGEKNPNYGKDFSEEWRRKISAATTGENNPNARKVIRLFDMTVYGYLNKAAQENNINRTTMKKYCVQHKGFMYYDEWLAEQENNVIQV